MTESLKELLKRYGTDDKPTRVDNEQATAKDTAEFIKEAIKNDKQIDHHK